MSSNNEMFFLADIALCFVGVPYVWGGNDITQGVDCSGYVAEVSRSCGLLDKRDLTAQGLYEYFFENSINSEISKNSLLFFGKSIEKISHVAIAINKHQLIEAGGEGRSPSNKGYVRIRPIDWRKDLVGVINIQNPCVKSGVNFLGRSKWEMLISKLRTIK